MASQNFRTLLREQAAANQGDDGGGYVDDNDDEYRPPSEAELKVLKARRERSDKIAKRMGEYLLKGWKMLDCVCSDCGTILLEVSAASGTYCIACRELESDVSKDDPAQSDLAARAHVREAAVAAAAASAGPSKPTALEAVSNGQSRDVSGPRIVGNRSEAEDVQKMRQNLRLAALNRLDFYRQQLLNSTDIADTEAQLVILDKLLQFVDRLG